jgi:hypothetical protein
MKRYSELIPPFVTIGAKLPALSDSRYRFPYASTSHLKRDGTAGAWLMCMVARPHRPENAARFVDDLARHCYFASSGHEHPEFPRRNKRAADDLDKPLERVMSDFRKGLEAGKRFNAAVLDKLVRSPSSIPAPDFVKRFAKPISKSLAELPGNDSDTRREIYWQKYLPYIHVAAAMYDTWLKMRR